MHGFLATHDSGNHGDSVQSRRAEDKQRLSERRNLMKQRPGQEWDFLNDETPCRQSSTFTDISQDFHLVSLKKTENCCHSRYLILTLCLYLDGESLNKQKGHLPPTTDSKIYLKCTGGFLLSKMIYQTKSLPTNVNIKSGFSPK